MSPFVDSPLCLKPSVLLRILQESFWIHRKIVFNSVLQSISLFFELMLKAVVLPLTRTDLHSLKPWEGDMRYKTFSIVLFGAVNFLFAGCAEFTGDYRGIETYRYPDSYRADRLAKGRIEIEPTGVFGMGEYKEVSPDAVNQQSPNSSPVQNPQSSSDRYNHGMSTPDSPYWSLLSRVVDHQIAMPRQSVQTPGKASGQDQIAASHATDDTQLVSDLLEVEQLRQSISDHPDRSMLPIRRDVILKCVLPPAQSVKETSVSLAATLEGLPQAKVGKAQLDTRFADKVVRLFEQTERTVFLQYALFRMCEMTVNSPVEFRNVFPIMLHRLIRQSATLNQEAAIVELKHATEEERTLQEKERTERVRLRMECISEQMKRAPIPGTDEMLKLCGPSEESIASPAKPTVPTVPVVNR